MRHVLTLLALLAASSAFAIEPKEMLQDPKLEARAREIDQQLACVVCQGETIDESGAEIAADIRVLVRQRIVAGDSNAQILSYMRERYGDFILMRPRVTPVTYMLWGGPLLVLLIGLVVVRRRLRATPTDAAPLTPEELAAVATLEKPEAR